MAPRLGGGTRRVGCRCASAACDRADRSVAVLYPIDEPQKGPSTARQGGNEACGCEVVTAESRGESETVTLEVGGGRGGRRVSPSTGGQPRGERAAARTSIRARRLAGLSQETTGNDNIHVLRWQSYGTSTAPVAVGDEAYRACSRSRTRGASRSTGKRCEDISSVQGE